MIRQKVENNYLYRKQFLLEFLKQLVQENAEKEYLSVTVTEEDYQIAQKICEGIEQDHGRLLSECTDNPNSCSGYGKEFYRCIYVCNGCK